MSSAASSSDTPKKPLPRVIDIADVPDETEELDENKKSLLKHLIGQLKVGMDLSKVTLPTHVLEPRSLLEKLTDFLVHGDILARSTDAATPIDRMKEIVRWYLSGWHLKSRGVKKPYNPILGETFEASYTVPETGTKIIYFAEQVSHHPPISALHGHIPAKNIVIDGYYYPKSRFLGNSAASLGDGRAFVHLMDHSETYVVTWPNVYARGILFGSLIMELGGKVSIECLESEYVCEIEFKTKGMFGGEYNKIEGKIRHPKHKKPLFKITGKWNEQMNIIEEATGISEVFFDPQTAPRLRKFIPDDEELPENNSLKIWANVTECLLKKDQDGATKYKSELEDKQRQEKKDRKDRKEDWHIKFFKKVNKHDWVLTKSPAAARASTVDFSSDEEKEEQPDVDY